MSIRRVGLAWSVAAALALALPAGIAAQATTKPADATGECKDGTFSTAASKRGACSGHGGIKTWYADAKSDTKAASKDAAKDTKAASKEAKKETKKETKAAEKDAAKDTKAASKEATKETKADTKTAEKESKAASKESKAASKTAPMAARPADAPADATAQCNDGSYSKAQHHQGACSGHKGVKAWFK